MTVPLLIPTMKVGGAVTIGIICFVFPSLGAEIPKGLEKHIGVFNAIPLAIVNGGRPRSASNGTTSTCPEIGHVACEDCSSGRVCYGEGEKDFRDFTCPNGTYCDENSKGCISSKSDCSLPVDRKYNCTGEGYFPIFDGKCQETRFCSNASAPAWPVKCQNSMKFDPKLELCIAGNVQCPNPCKNRKFGYTSSPEIRPFYVFCFGENDYLTFKCPQGNELVDVSCQPECSTIGQKSPKLPRKENCKKFYQCISTSNGLVRYLQECPGNLWFDGKQCSTQKPDEC